MQTTTVVTQSSIFFTLRFFDPATLLNILVYGKRVKFETRARPFSQTRDAIAITVNGANRLRTKPLEKAVINTSDPQ